MVLLIATRKGAWLYHGDARRESWRRCERRSSALANGPCASARTGHFWCRLMPAAPRLFDLRHRRPGDVMDEKDFHLHDSNIGPSQR